MALLLVNLPGPWFRFFAAPGWFTRGVNSGSCRAAPNRITRSSHLPHSRRRRSRFTRDASDTSPCRRAGDSRQRARPPKSDGFRKATRRGNRDPRAVGGGRVPSLHRVGSVRLHSVVRLHRLGDDSRRLRSQIRSPAWGPIQSWVGSGMCRSETTRDRVPKERLIHRGRRVAPVRRAAPHTGPGGRCHKMHASRSVHVFPLRQGFWFLVLRHDARKRLASKGTCLRHR